MTEYRRGRIAGIGIAGTLDGKPMLSGWHTEGGDYPATDFATGSISGWYHEELRILADVSHAWGEDVALQLAETLIDRPSVASRPSTSPVVGADYFEVPI